MFNPFIMYELFRTKYIEYIFCKHHDPTRIEYIKFILRILTWKPRLSQPMMGFDINQFKLLLINLLANETPKIDNTTSSTYHDDDDDDDDGVHINMNNNAKQIKLAKQKLQYQRSFYSNLTLFTWLDIINSGSNGPNNGIKIALQQLILFTDNDVNNANPTNVTNSSTAATNSTTTTNNKYHNKNNHGDANLLSCQRITNTIVSTGKTLDNIIKLISLKNDEISCMSCTLLRNMLTIKSILRYQLMHMKILPILFSSLVPVENINILINYTNKSEYDAKEREKNIYLLASKNGQPESDGMESDSSVTSATSGDEEDEDNDNDGNEDFLNRKTLQKNKLLRPVKRMDVLLMPKVLKRAFNHTKAKTTTNETYKLKSAISSSSLKIKRINQIPYRSLALLVEIVSLLEILGSDPKIKRHIHDIKTFPNCPSKVNYGPLNNDGIDKIPICFYSFGLLLFGPMSYVLVPSSSSITGKAAAVVPLYHSITKTLTAMCRFDQRNKIAVSSAVLPSIIDIFMKTKSRSLIKELLKLLHSICSEYINLNQYDRDLIEGIDSKLRSMEENIDFKEIVIQIKELIH